MMATKNKALAMNTEIVFTIEQAPEGGLIARAAGQAIFVEAESVPELHDKVRDAVACHFDAADAPQPIRLRFVRDEVTAALNCCAVG